MFRYGERFDWLSFHYEGFWCSSLAVSFTWPLLNEVLCLDVIECRILARSFWNPTLALSVTYLTMWPWAKLLPSLTCVCWGKGCGSCLVGWRQGSDGSGALSPICRYSVTVHCFCISTFRQAHKVILWLTVICLVLCCLFFFFLHVLRWIRNIYFNLTSRAGQLGQICGCLCLQAGVEWCAGRYKEKAWKGEHCRESSGSKSKDSTRTVAELSFWGQEEEVAWRAWRSHQKWCFFVHQLP